MICYLNYQFVPALLFEGSSVCLCCIDGKESLYPNQTYLEYVNFALIWLGDENTNESEQSL